MSVQHWVPPHLGKNTSESALPSTPSASSSLILRTCVVVHQYAVDFTEYLRIVADRFRALLAGFTFDMFLYSSSCCSEVCAGSYLGCGRLYATELATESLLNAGTYTYVQILIERPADVLWQLVQDY